MGLIGYSDEWSVAPGQEISFKISTTSSSVRAEIVRVDHGDNNPAGPGLTIVPMKDGVTGTLRGRQQRVVRGSYLEFRLPPALRALPALSFAMWVQPTLLRERPRQVIAAWMDPTGRGFRLVVTDIGAVVLDFGDGRSAGSITIDGAVTLGSWYLIGAGLDRNTASLMVVPAGTGAKHLYDEAAAHFIGADDPWLTVGAARDAAGLPEEAFNGRVERPVLYDRTLSATEHRALAEGSHPAGAIADWDLGATASSVAIADRGRFAVPGRCVNMPTRAVLGHCRPDDVADSVDDRHFSAVHLHEDDIGDAGWDEDVTLRVPSDWRSGVYALHATADGASDFIPFAVKPQPGATVPVLLVLPTLTYLAYANERSLRTVDLESSGILGRPVMRSDLDDLVGRHPEWGLSQYDLHADGSPVYYSSRRRPIPNIRPTYRHWATAAPRGLSADLYLVDWLTRGGYKFGCVTDEDLHFDGVSLLANTRVLVLGTHPEYWTHAMLRALSGFLDSGGSVMYLGGNGLYGVSSIHPEVPYVSEVRRSHAGTRPWNPGRWENRHSTTGEPGGIWRHRGVRPNGLLGVGFAAQGWDEQAAGYRRLPDSFDPRAAWIFDGVGADEIIGDFGLVMGGAAGDEVDRADGCLGTPEHALRLATSTQSRYYMQAVEDILSTSGLVNGENNSDVRADIVYFETNSGGAVFSVGSICWAGALPVNGYQNNVARITSNVLDGLLRGVSGSEGGQSLG